MNKKLLLLFTLIPLISFGQNYTSYFTGNFTDLMTNPQGGICLMGGASEDDNAMKWFLQRADGGDILVLRATGSDGYNDYLYQDLGIPVNSVETIVCHNVNASFDNYLINKINQAEAVWFAGGNQWTYVSYWRNTPIDSAINQAIQQRNIVIGGTSAGMAIQGEYYFSAQNGTITSSAALSNPFSNELTIDSASFINNQYLSNTITDTHFDNPDRKGRLMTFLARIKTDYGVFAKAIACDGYTAVCIDTNGIARVFGGHPTYDDNAYFIQSNCELTIQTPENCSTGNPLTWNLGELAIKSYQIKGDSSGSRTFDLNTWQSGTGGTWYNWFVSNGNFNEQMGTAINCSPLSIVDITNNSQIQIYPNPAHDRFFITFNDLSLSAKEINLYNTFGQKLVFETSKIGNDYIVDISSLQNGIYFIAIEGINANGNIGKLIKH